MIYTITFNPAIDLVVKVPNCELGTLNRSIEENYVAGGKGINMSVVLKRLGFDNTATGFLAVFQETSSKKLSNPKVSGQTLFKSMESLELI